MNYEDKFPEFITLTCYEWLALIKSNQEKEIIIESLRYLTQQNKIEVHAFVLMDNHMHLIWRIKKGYLRQNIQRDFLHHTAKQILKYLKDNHSEMINQLEVNLKDRKFQVWQRNSLSIELRTKEIYEQKLNYIHNNPVKAGICIFEEEYKYSSAKFYITNEKDWDFLKHGDE